jgi:hypothetical protein
MKSFEIELLQELRRNLDEVKECLENSIEEVGMLKSKLQH